MLLKGNEEQSYFRQRQLTVPMGGVTTLPCIYRANAVLVVLNGYLCDKGQANVSSGTQIAFSRPLTPEDKVVVLDLPTARVSPGLAKLMEAYGQVNRMQYVSNTLTITPADSYGTIVCQNTANVTFTLPAGNLMGDGTHLTLILDSDFSVTLTSPANDMRGLGVTGNNTFLLTERGCHVELVATTTGWFVVDTNHYSLMNYRAVVGAIEFFPSRSVAATGTIFMDGQTVNRDTYPSLWAMVLAGTVPVIAEATWLADPTKRYCYTTGNGSTTFRLPDYNKQQVGSTSPPFLGDVNNTAGAYAVRAFGTVTQVGSANAAQLATDMANVLTKVGQLGATTTQVYMTAGTFTWTVPSYVKDGTRKVRVTVTAGGGGGGCTNASQAGGGGGAGGTAIETLDLTGVTSVTVTVGAAGTGATAAGNKGGNGGTSSFGAYCTAGGGVGADQIGGQGGIGGSGDMNFRGGYGNDGSPLISSVFLPIGGQGGSSYWGGGAKSTAAVTAMTAAPGCGGPGTYTSGVLGNVGQPGCVLIEF